MNAQGSKLVERVARALAPFSYTREDMTLTQYIEQFWLTHTDEARAALSACHAEEVAAAVRANDALIRAIRHRDARWHDDELVKRLLERNNALLAKLDGQP